MPRSNEWSRRATSYQRPSYRARSNGVTGVMPSGGRVDEQPLKASIATASPNQAQRRKQDRKEGINYQLVTKQTNWYSATTSAAAAKARRGRLPWATRKLCP